MQGILFYDVARRLYAELRESSPNEAFARTITGRVCYAALLVLRDEAEIDTSGRGGHWRVWDHYRRVGGAGEEISGWLKLLMEPRIAADCEMDSCLTIHDAEKSLELRQTVLEYIPKTL